jgi:hypothetical protein
LEIMHWSRVLSMWLALGLAVGCLQFFLTDWAAGLDPDKRCRELELTLPALTRIEHAGQDRIPPGTRCRVTECAEVRERSGKPRLDCRGFRTTSATIVIPAHTRDLIYLAGASFLFTPLIALLVVAATRGRFGRPGSGA